jgi:hypothetical protein
VLALTDDAGTLGSTSQSLTVNIFEAPQITSPSSATLFIGMPGSFAVTTSGYPSLSTQRIVADPIPPTDPTDGTGMYFTVTGLPANLQFSNLNPAGYASGTLIIQGTPSGDDAGMHQVQITAQNGVGATAQQTLALNITKFVASTTTTTLGTVATSTTTLSSVATTTTTLGTVATSTTTVSSVPTTTTTTLPCGSNPRCVLEATTSPPCAGQTIPSNITKKLNHAASLLEQASTAPAKRARRLRSKASHLLKAAGTAAKRATSGKHPKLSFDCAAAIRDAAGTQRQGLKSP